MMVPVAESIFEKLRAINNLVSDPGATDGERQNGKDLLENLLVKYNLKIEDIETIKKEKFSFSFSSKSERQLLFQVIATVVGDQVFFSSYSPKSGKRSKHTIWIDLTKLDAAEIQVRYKHFRLEFEKELENFTSAFIHSNNIFPPNEKNEEKPKLTPEEIEKMLRILALAAGIRPTPLPKVFMHLEATNAG